MLVKLHIRKLRYDLGQKCKKTAKNTTNLRKLDPFNLGREILKHACKDF